ncbi:rod shape-determining protein MreD [Nocardioides pacificus]
MRAARIGLAALAVVAAVVLQVTVFSHVAWEGVVPNLCLLVVVATALSRGPQAAAVLGFFAGVALDLAPPADHVAGRWALALVVVGYVAGRVRQDARPSVAAVVATVAASSFVGTSIFALSGLVLKDPIVSVPDLLQVITIGVAWDVVLTPFVLPPMLALLSRLQPGRVPA